MFNIIQSKNYKFILRYCYSQDKNLIEKYHVVAGTGLFSCIEKTVEDFKNMHESFKFFVIKKDEELFGYFGTENIDNKNYLTSFFILPNFRNEGNSKEFFSLVNKHFNNKSFTVGIYSKNTRAENWLKKNGGTLVGIGPDARAYEFLGVA